MTEKRASVVSDVELRGGPVPGDARVLTRRTVCDDLTDTFLARRSSYLT